MAIFSSPEKALVERTLITRSFVLILTTQKGESTKEAGAVTPLTQQGIDEPVDDSDVKATVARSTSMISRYYDGYAATDGAVISK